MVDWKAKSPREATVKMRGKGAGYNVSTGVINHPRKGEGKIKVTGGSVVGGLIRKLTK